MSDLKVVATAAVAENAVSGDEPDISFTLGGASTAAHTFAARAEPLRGSDELLRELVGRLRELGPIGWQRLDAIFVLTVRDSGAVLLFSSDETVSRVEVTEPVLAVVRQHRETIARSGEDPWWRLLLTMTPTDVARVYHDHGEEPFPNGQLLTPESYRADLAAFPRSRLPVWLAAYLTHGGRQSRTAEQAAAAARIDRAQGRRAVRVGDELPALPVVWARWAVLSAAFVAVRSERGPRMLPSVAWFEAVGRSGSTLYRLPGDRAVLSGGVWNTPILDRAYNRRAGFPELCAGAPEWVTDLVLNERARAGLLSFCYWWDGGTWQRGDSSSVAESGAAIPGVWTAQTVTEIVVRQLGDAPEDVRAAVASLLSAAEARVVERDAVHTAFGGAPGSDIDGALYQLSVAGVVAEIPEIDQEHK